MFDIREEFRIREATDGTSSQVVTRSVMNQTTHAAGTYSSLPSCATTCDDPTARPVEKHPEKEWLIFRTLQFNRQRRLQRGCPVQQHVVTHPASPQLHCEVDSSLLPPHETTSIPQSSFHNAPLVRLTAEDDEGDVEYKWRLTGISAVRFEHLVTQMQFRVTEGNGQCLYQLGVLDNGVTRGLPQSELTESIETIGRMAGALHLDWEVLQQYVVRTEPEELLCGEVLVSRRHAGGQDVSVVFCGAVGGGKSTLMGVLLSETLDDGTGNMRQALFNHKHEIDSGRTSSIATRLWEVQSTEDGRLTPSSEASQSELYAGTTPEGGVDSTSSQRNTLLRLPSMALPSPPPPPQKTSSRTTTDHSRRSQISMAASPFNSEAAAMLRRISLTDVGGDITKSMLFALMSRRPDHVCLCASADAAAEDITLYAQVCCAMGTSFIVVVTKCDAVADFELDAFCMNVAAALDDVGCACDVVETKAMALAYSQQWLPHHMRPPSSSSAYSTKQSHAALRVPLYAVSSVTGVGLELLIYGLSHLRSIPQPPSAPSSHATFSRAPLEVLLDAVFHVTGVGPVVRGRVTRGPVEVGAAVYVGPDAAGDFFPVVVCGIHVDGTHVNEAKPLDMATFALNRLPPTVDVSHKGKLLLREPTDASTVVVLRVRVLSQSLSLWMQPILYSRNARQAVRVLHTALVSGAGEWIVTCSFMFRPEVLAVDAAVVLHWTPNGIAVGRVSELLPAPMTDLHFLEK